MLVRRQQLVQVRAHVGHVEDLGLLLDVEPGHTLQRDLGDDAHRAGPADRRTEQLVGRLHLVHLPGSVHQGQPDDRLTDESPVAPGPVDVGGENSADALRVVRRQRREGQIMIGEDLHDVAYAGPALHGDLPAVGVGRHEAGKLIQRDQDPVRHDTFVERVTAAEDPEAARALHQCDDFRLTGRAPVLGRGVPVAANPVPEDTPMHAALQPEEPLARGQIADDVESRGTDDLAVAGESHLVLRGQLLRITHQRRGQAGHFRTRTG